MEKTNAMRILERAGIVYDAKIYDDSVTDGESVARLLGEDPNSVFKTLVTVSGNEHFVFMLPVCLELDLKKAADAAGVKSVSMLKQKELFPLTGYVHGGCSPVGMKKRFLTVIDETALLLDEIFFSGGRKGMQIKVDRCEIATFLGARFADISNYKP